jgi:hypothetical protein
LTSDQLANYISYAKLTKVLLKKKTNLDFGEKANPETYSKVKLSVDHTTGSMVNSDVLFIIMFGHYCLLVQKLLIK